MATVSDLELDSPTSRILDQVPPILEQPPSSAFPALRSFILREVELDLSPHWNGLARALTSRRSNLRTVRVFLRDEEFILPQEIRALFAEYLEDGLDIYIGADEEFGGTNLLAAG
ncbi:hypothetical protein FB45DRAFT_1017271 [Roridomyces roridus]|uniref:Uncharacterized protein n=1 Tax=Roridomyces roridus TaxID=1738132 RepID=A0AAD7CI64_9AGAR|nr:hypothetical protein FB45DRAFT_1017271 [Roridomyces roridus]